MGRSRYRKSDQSIEGNTVFIANRLSPIGALYLGVFSFALFYFVLPTFAQHQLDGSHSKLLRPFLELFIAEKIRGSENLGVVLCLICFLIATWKLFFGEPLDPDEERDANFIARILSRLFG